MRSTAAMSEPTPPMDPGTLKAVLGWLTGLATATIGALGLFLAQRVLGKAAFQTAINDGFKKLHDAEEQHRVRLEGDLASLRTTFNAAQVQWAAERASLEGQIRNLTQANLSLRHLLQRAGLSVPDEPAGPSATGATIIEGGERK